MKQTLGKKCDLTEEEEIQILCQDLKRYATNGEDYLNQSQIISAYKQFLKISKTAEMIYLRVNGS